MKLKIHRAGISLLVYYCFLGILSISSCSKNEFKISNAKRGKWMAYILIERADSNKIVTDRITDTLLLDFLDESNGKIIRTDSFSNVNDFTWMVGTERGDKIYTRVKYLNPPTLHELFYIVKSSKYYEKWEFTDLLWFAHGDRIVYNIELFKQ